MFVRKSASLLLFVLVLAVGPRSAAPRPDGELTVEVVDAETLQPVVARMHLKNSRGRPVRLRVVGLNQFADHFYIDGTMTLGLRVGQYTFELEAGPEYRTQQGHFEIERHAEDTKRIEMHPFADLAKEGWFGGDLDVERLRGGFAAGDAIGVARLRAESRRGRQEHARGGAAGVWSDEAAR